MTPGANRRAVVALSLAGLLAACGGPSTSLQQGSRGDPLVAVDGGSVTLAVDSVPTTLNDHSLAGNTPDTRVVDSLIWAQVFQVGPRLVPTLDTTVVQSAEVVSVSPQTVVYQIDPKATWSDGTAVSAQDFVYAWLAQQGTGRDVDGSPDSVISKAGYDDISSVVGSNGGRTVTVTFSTPFADWPSLFDDLLPAQVAERAGWNHGFDSYGAATSVSAGPWVVTAWTPGQRLVLGRNPRWWGTQPHVNQIILKAVPGAPSMVAALQSGAVQVMAAHDITPATEAAVSSLPDAEQKVSLGTQMLQLVFQTHHAPLDSAAVRQGIAHLVDRAGLASTLAQPIMPASWEDNNFLYANVQASYTDDAAGFEKLDTTAAVDDLVDGGLTADSRGHWTIHGAPVELRFLWASDDPWSAAVAPVIGAELTNAGFDVQSLPTSEASLMSSVLPGGTFDLALASQPASAYPSDMSSVYGVSAESTVSTDWSGYDDPKVDRLFAQASSQLAAEQAQALYQQIDADLWNAMPVLPLFAEPTMVAWSTAVAGVADDPGGLGPLWSVMQWQTLAPAAKTTTTSANRGG